MPAKQRPLQLLTPFLLLMVTGCQPSVTETAPSAANQPAHLQTLRLLQHSDTVIPPALAAHPVAAAYNREAIIPPQCYTRTEGQHNPCYVCHQDAIASRENVMNDGDLQEAYSFSDLGMTNHWKNLFQDRSLRVKQISDAEILDWVDQDNYSELAARLRNSNFSGWVPDLQNLALAADAFDAEGFAKDGSHWVAFNYKPFPSTFWPTNGSTDDVMIKLPEAYRSNQQGAYSLDVYKANLAIVEAQLKGLSSISSLPVDERLIGVDIDNNGQLTMTSQINNVSQYVGAASGNFIDSFLYPEGTEFLHTVRYLGFNAEGDIAVSKRMKEVRYMKKWQTYNKDTLARYYQEEGFAKEAGHLPGYTNLKDHGLDNGMGWSVQGFIENANGRLRATSYEENLFCMGCHSSIGATIDKTFSFARKVDGQQGWGYINLKGMPDAPNKGEQQGEIATYFARAGGGDEFRSNPEMQQRWFHADGSVNQQAIAGKDVYQLITPSRERALQLNKAYKAIVEQQSFLFGRDATVLPPHNVYQSIDNLSTPTLQPQAIYVWDLRLDWQAEQNR
jgi:hypothetical protein